MSWDGRVLGMKQKQKRENDLNQKEWLRVAMVRALLINGKKTKRK